jgi:glycosyltransferase involved in cell wall biosynthesis
VPVPVVISTAHNIHEGSGWREMGYRLTDRLSDVTTQVSEAGRARYVAIKAVPPDRIVLIPNGVDVSHFRRDEDLRRRARQKYLNEEKFVWLAVGRLSPQKNYPLLLRAFVSVVKIRPEAILMIVGDGPLKQQLVDYSEKLGLRHSVRFVGLHDDIVTIMNMSDGFVLSSSWEGMPMVLLEAAACEVPIVATNVGGVSEVFEHGKAGFVVPGEDEAHLADGMHKLMRLSKEERKEFGVQARERVLQKYDIEVLSGDWDALYRRLMADKGLKMAGGQ